MYGQLLNVKLREMIARISRETFWKQVDVISFKLIRMWQNVLSLFQKEQESLNSTLH